MTHPIKTKTLVSNFKRKGFEVSENDHTHMVYCIDGKETVIRTKISHGADEIGQPLISTMARQIKLDTDQFVKFAKCDITEEQYRRLLAEKGIIELEIAS